MGILKDKLTINFNRFFKNSYIPNRFEHLYIEVSNISNLGCKSCDMYRSIYKKNKAYNSHKFRPTSLEKFVDLIS